jgi:hypothetical protein
MFSPDWILVVDPGLLGDRRREVADLLRRDVRRAAGALQDGVGLLGDLVRLLERAVGAHDALRQTGERERAGGDAGAADPQRPEPTSAGPTRARAPCDVSTSRISRL